MMDGTTGAMPSDGATPPQAAVIDSTGATPGGAADDEESALGEAGKAILRDARRAAREAATRANAAERELEALRKASQTDQEKALDAARKEGETQATTRYQALVRRSEVRGALRSAGMTSTRLLDLAVSAPEFAALPINDDGEVVGLSRAVEALKREAPDLFTSGYAAVPTRGVQPSGTLPGDDMNSRIRRAAGRSV